MDKERIVSYNEGIPVFDDPNINAIFDKYNVTNFSKAFPLSGYDYLRKIYQITADSVGLAQELVEFDNGLFPSYQQIEDNVPIGSYYPNDWTGHWPFDTLQLSLINAPEAWDICKGDPNILIAVADFGFDTTHPDMQGQYAKLGLNSFHPAFESHGTLVASMIAAKTDNNTGITGIGFNCRLFASVDMSPSWYLQTARDTSVGRVRVTSHSYRGPYLDNLYFAQEGPDQLAFNEIYELGILSVAGAANGTAQVDSTARAETYVFPASYDHVIAVSSVGYEAEPGDSAFNAKYVHELYAGDTTLSHQHIAVPLKFKIVL